MIIWFVLNTHVKKLFSLKVFSHNKLLFHFTNDTDEWQNWYLWSIFYFEWHYGSMKFGPFFVGGTLFSCYVIGCIYTVNLKWSFSRLIISKKKKRSNLFQLKSWFLHHYLKIWHVEGTFTHACLKRLNFLPTP